MSQHDTEMLQAFKEEIVALKNELDPIYKALKENPNQSPLFEKFGQIIDRIYGTAATMGFKDFAEYCRTLKTICYKCSQSKNLYAQGKVKDLMFVCIGNLDRLAVGVLDPKTMRPLQNIFRAEREKAESLSKAIFNTIKRTSTAA